MTVEEAQKRLREVRKEYVFTAEAKELLQKKYSKDSARVLLSKLSQTGIIETIQEYRQPPMYKKSDIIKYLGDK